MPTRSQWKLCDAERLLADSGCCEFKDVSKLLATWSKRMMPKASTPVIPSNTSEEAMRWNSWQLYILYSYLRVGALIVQQAKHPSNSDILAEMNAELRDLPNSDLTHFLLDREVWKIHPNTVHSSKQSIKA